MSHGTVMSLLIPVLDGSVLHLASRTVSGTEQVLTQSEPVTMHLPNFNRSNFHRINNKQQTTQQHITPIGATPVNVTA